MTTRALVLRARVAGAAVLLTLLSLVVVPPAALHAHAAASTTVMPLQDGGFEQPPPQSAWIETQSSGGELIDNFNPHSGSLAADLCDIDNCNDGHGNAGDTLIQSFTDPGQVVSATLSYYYSVATSEPNSNSACHDWLTVGIGAGRTQDSTATKRYCSPTGSQYVAASTDVTPLLSAHGGASLNVQIEGYTDGLYPSEFFVDDVSLSITYLVTPSAPVVNPITDCSTGGTILQWSAPQFPLGSSDPVTSYTVTPYTVSGAAQTPVTVPGYQTQLPVSLQQGTVCYFTVSATNSNGSGPAGSPSVPVVAVAPLSQPTSTGFGLSWSLQPASAPASSYTVFIRDGNGPWLPWASTAGSSTVVYGTPGHSYEYYVEGFDAAGGVAPNASGQTAVTVPATATPAMSLKALYGVDAYGALHPADSPPLQQPTIYNWKIARAIALNASGAGGYVLDGWGGIHAFGNAPAVSASAYWGGWDIARSIALRPDGVSGYVLDGFGGIHAFGGAPPLASSAYWSGWDIARGIALDSTGRGGYVLDGWGGLHAFGDAPRVLASAVWTGWDIARGLVVRADGASGYVLDGFGGVHAFGGAPAAPQSAYWSGSDIARGLVLAPSGAGGWVLDGFGGFHPFGSGAGGVGTPNYAGVDVMRGLGGA